MFYPYMSFYKKKITKLFLFVSKLIVPMKKAQQMEQNGLLRVPLSCTALENRRLPNCILKSRSRETIPSGCSEDMQLFFFGLISIKSPVLSK